MQKSLETLVGDEKLKVKAAKVVYPMRWYNLSEADRVIAMVRNLRYSDARMTKEEGAGYMACLKDAERKNETKTIFQLQESLVEKFYGGSHPDYLYVCAADFGRTSCLWGLSGSSDVESGWRSYFDREFRNFMDSFRLRDEIEKLNDEFFKFMPFMKMKLTGSLDLSFGHCCEDCSGDERRYRELRLDTRLREWAEKLKKVEIIK